MATLACLLAGTPSALQHVSRTPAQLSRRTALVGAGAAVAGLPHLAIADDKADKQYRLPADKLAAIITKDLEERQFLVTGALTRSIYDESCIFQDEIDTYSLDKWMCATTAATPRGPPARQTLTGGRTTSLHSKGTNALFVGEKSRVKLASPVVATADEVRFRFDEATRSAHHRHLPRAKSSLMPSRRRRLARPCGRAGTERRAGRCCAFGSRSSRRCR